MLLNWWQIANALTEADYSSNVGFSSLIVSCLEAVATQPLSLVSPLSNPQQS